MRKSGELVTVSIAYYKLYVRLRQAELLSKHSPKDIIEQSKAIYQMKIRSEWYRSEITEKTRRLFAKIGVDYQPDTAKQGQNQNDKSTPVQSE